MSQWNNLNNRPNHDDERRNPNHNPPVNQGGGRPDKKCNERHKHRVANAVLELAIDISTDFDLER